MKKYDEYKDSGVAWIGKVPKHWEVLRGKYALSILSGFPFDSQKFEFEDNGVYMPLIRIRDINCSSTEVYYSGSYPIESVVKTGEVLIGMDGDFNISKWKGTNALLNQRVCKLREDSSMNTHYAFYMLSSPLKAINSVTYATTVKHLSVYDIYNVFIPVPPISEQTAIATYLDTHCAKIDNLISIQQKRIALLQELKQSVITHAVTKGLNPNVEMKPSGVEWIGDVPKHWEVMPFKRAMTIYNGSDYKHIQVDVAGYPVIGSGGEFARASQYVYDGEVVLLGRKGTIDKPMYYNGKFWTVDTMFYAIPKKHVNCKYLYYQALIIPFDRYATSTALPSMTQTDLNFNIIGLPPTVEQAAIASYLDHKCATIDTSISNAQHQIELLQEYKQSLITEVVTGKRKVTDN